MAHRIVGMPLGESVVSIYGESINGQIERPEIVRWLRARGLEVVKIDDDVAYPIPADGVLDPNVLTWNCALLGTADGYGNSAERMLLALEASGQRVSLEDGYTVTAPETMVSDIVRRPFIPGAARIVYSQPNATWRQRYGNQPTIGFTMWEDDTLPLDWNPFLRVPAAIAAPSRFCCEVIERRLSELHIEKPVFQIPLGVAHGEIPYHERTYDPARDVFTFLWSAVNVADPRKAAHEAIAAFQEAFTGSERVRLIMRSRYGQIATTDPRIEWRVAFVPERQKHAVLYDAHAYFYPSFGEGFGLMPLEAIVSGLPAICSDNSALSEYRDFFLPIACDPAPSGILGTGGVVETTGTWMRPRRVDLVRGLRAMIEHYPERKVVTATAAQRIRHDWGYNHTAKALLNMVDTVREVTA